MISISDDDPILRDILVIIQKRINQVPEDPEITIAQMLKISGS